jgi:MoaA/NifB/PqqE/SkfB family radical SAM enzyme
MLKHLLTAKCNRKCGYCISRNVHQEQAPVVTNRLKAVYDSFPDTQLMLTGGEPSMAEGFEEIVLVARMRFDELFLTTPNPQMITKWLWGLVFDAITFSIHDAVIPEVKNSATAYASILDARYTPELVDELRAKGYAGLTINEEHRGTAVFDETQLPKVDGFSIRVNRRGKCLSEPMIMPDLTTIADFSEYL